MSALLAIVPTAANDLGSVRPVPARFGVPSSALCGTCEILHDIEALSVVPGGFVCTACDATDEADSDFRSAQVRRTFVGPAVTASAILGSATVGILTAALGSSWLSGPSFAVFMAYVGVLAVGFTLSVSGLLAGLRTRGLASSPIAVSSTLTRVLYASHAMTGLTGAALMLVATLLAGLGVASVL
jgi:hypothetical protein